MTAMGRFLFHVARLIAGKDRAEWIDAMAAEASLVSGDSTPWALGCVWASMKDRLRRDWWFPAAILLLPVCALVWKTFVFFWTSSPFVHQTFPGWLWVACWILSPFPFVFLFARWRQGSSAAIALAICFILVEFSPLFMMWIDFGVSPSIWFTDHFHLYKADPNIDLGLAAGLSLDLLVWLCGAWLGRYSRRLTASR